MHYRLAQLAIIVRDYDEAIQYYTDILGFKLLEDTQLTPQKRWVVLSPGGTSGECQLLLAKAANTEQEKFIGNQAGGRVFLFLHTDDFGSTYQRFLEKGVEFVRPPALEAYGKVAVFRDLYGNLWDLIQPA
jgi:catechol 2,3-dioxygenase-like lactoylglutathione lyase family enzyme